MLLFVFGFDVTKFLIIIEKKIPNYGDFFLNYSVILLQTLIKTIVPYLEAHYSNQNIGLYLLKK